MFRLVFLLALIGALYGQTDEAPLLLPDSLDACLKMPRAKDLEIVSGTPVYLRGDFDGDGRPDHAIAMKSTKTKQLGLLICRGNGMLTILGQGLGSSKFSDMPEDNFLGPSWYVLTRSEVADYRRYNRNVPAAVRGEAIEMIWEDGTGLVYWDGARFRWAAP